MLCFRASTVKQAIEVLKKIVRMENMTVSEGLVECFRIPEITFLAGRMEKFATFVSNHRGIEMVSFLIISFVLALSAKDKCVDKFKPTVMKCIMTVFFFSWSVISFATVVEYIYGGF